MRGQGGFGTPASTPPVTNRQIFFFFVQFKMAAAVSGNVAVAQPSATGRPTGPVAGQTGTGSDMSARVRLLVLGHLRRTAPLARAHQVSYSSRTFRFASSPRFFQLGGWFPRPYFNSPPASGRVCAPLNVPYMYFHMYNYIYSTISS